MLVTQHPTFSWSQSLMLQGEGKNPTTNKLTNESSTTARTANRSHVVQVKRKAIHLGSCELRWQSQDRINRLKNDVGEFYSLSIISRSLMRPHTATQEKSIAVSGAEPTSTALCESRLPQMVLPSPQYLARTLYKELWPALSPAHPSPIFNPLPLQRYPVTRRSVLSTSQVCLVMCSKLSFQLALFFLASPATRWVQPYKQLLPQAGAEEGKGKARDSVI